MMTAANIPKIVFLIGLVCFAAIGSAAVGVIDDFDFQTDEEVRSVWSPSKESSQALLSASGEWGDERMLVFPIDMRADTDRNYWDRNIESDLSTTPNFSLRVFVANPSLISRFTLYFRSSKGWTGGNTTVERSGWQTLEFTKGTFWDEGGDFDWKAVQGIRISVWKKEEGKSFIAVDRLSGYVPPVVVVKGSAQKDSPNEYYSTRMAKTMSSILESNGISHGVITAEDVLNGSLTGSLLAVFPYNVAMSTAEQECLRAFVLEGGRLIHFYELPGSVAKLLGIRETGWIKEDYPGELSACRFSSKQINGLPERMAQHSWNIRLVEPVSPDAEIIAHWENDKGEMTAYPAWLASSTGAFMSHILLNEDKESARKVVMALVGHYCPTLWQDAVAHAVQQTGHVGEFEEYTSLVTYIRTQQENSVSITDSLKNAETLMALAETKRLAGDFPTAFDAALQARQHLVTAYILAQEPRADEFRAVWEHSGLGVYPGDWEKSVIHLKQAGFGHIIPNMMSSGSAVYASDYLPRSTAFETYGDQITACVEAAHKHGLKVHIWKVNYNLGSHAPEEWVEKLQGEKRLQVDVDGNLVKWLCPSNPENAEFETNVMLEVVRNYDVDGIHFDYIRYPDEHSCYCDGCRERFEQAKALRVTNWPADCYRDGELAEEYRNWRSDQITQVVKVVSEESRKLKPEVQVSAAVFAHYPQCREQRGQDWVQWIQEGYLDFVCPMDYTESLSRFREMVSEQVKLVDSRIPLYPGISVSSTNLPLDGLIAQIRTTRTLGANGFTIFQYDKSSDAFALPRLGERITAPR